MSHDMKSSDASPGGVERLANFALSVSAEAIPPKLLDRAKLLLLDTIGCGYAGLDEHAARAVVETTRGLGGAPHCSVLGQSWKTNLANATLANGVLIRAHDLNDYVVNAEGSIGGHPSDNIPVALAAGEIFERSGREVLASIVMGYEIFGRMRAAMDRKSPWDGVSVSGAVAAGSAGRLMGLDHNQMSQAIALALAHCAVPAVVRSGDISAAKSIANALVAQSGVQAALLAKRGVTGPLEIFEHRRGLGSLFTNKEAMLALDAPLSATPYIETAMVKAYPCLATGQAAVAAGLQLHRLLAGDTSRLTHIRVIMGDYPVIREQQADRGRANPMTREAADHSFHFLTAVALLDGAFGLRQFDNDRWNDPAVRAIMGRLDMEVDPTLNERAPGLYPCALEARHGDGDVTRVEVLQPPGYSNGGLDEALILQKFNTLTREHLPAAAGQRLIDAAMSLHAAQTCSNLFAAMGETMAAGQS